MQDKTETDQYQYNKPGTCTELMTPLAKLESRPATFVTPWRTPSFMSDKSALLKDDDEVTDERLGPEPNSSSLEMLELPSNLLRFARISY